ncbi:LacI family DNA-binding transcriptional regulator [Domibacillus tundrae]|uniref:LacI family DNA-binding transcriptional regulator n=1 Tax=Domibacillus tundrae TaxID=1587527 RepID=UPI000617D509|nr:LacI family DNA-binding transcriptional regulator [Domibacillus tundrae]
MTTIKDIAKHVGVSVTTVSRALNGYGDVNEQTRQRIIRASKELNYSPNSIARSLVMNQSKTIGLLVSGFTRESVKDNFFAEVMTGINEYVASTDYDLILFNTTSSKQREKTYRELCMERRVDGVIVQGIRTDDPYLQEVVDSNIPCVFIDIPVTSEHVGSVSIDNRKGAEEAVSYLISLGHRHIGFVNGHEFAFVSRHRLEGYQSALQKAGIPFCLEYTGNGKFEEGAGGRAALKLLEQNPEITALFCASDLMAIGAIKEIHASGRQIPNDVSLIGFDDILLSSYVQPELTTIAQNMYGLGQEAAKQLISILKNESVAKHIIMEHTLQERQSCKKVKEKRSHK